MNESGKKEFPFASRPLEPVLKTPHWFSLDCNEEYLPRILERQMFFAYSAEELEAYKKEPRDRIYYVSNPTKRRIEVDPPEQFDKVFPNFHYDDLRDDYTYESYAEQYPLIEERTATYAMIFTDGSKVVCAVGYTYKYEDWRELLSDMIGQDGAVCGRKGLHRAFVLYTDSGDYLPIWTLYEKTVAGFAVDQSNKTVTAFDPRSAVMIFHSLYQLCSEQYGRWYGQTGRGESEPHLHDDSGLLSNNDPYVKAFRERLDEYQYRFDRKTLWKELNEYEFAIVEI